MLPICASVDETSTEGVLARMQGAAPHCGLLEVRLDLAPLGALDLARILTDPPRPVLITNRPVREGGQCQTPEPERLATLVQAARLGAAWVDVEWDALDELPELPSETRLVVSRHPGQAPRDEQEILALLSSLRSERAAVQKLAVPVDDAAAALRLLRLAGQEACPTIAMAMGFPGVVSRLAGPRWGAPWVYAAADADRPTAPGQLGARRLLDLWHGRPPTRATHLYGVIGNPVDHSRSPDIHNAAFAELGQDAVYTWLETSDLAALLDEAQRDPGIRGLSVTIPHKVAAARAAGVQVSSEAVPLRAINTLVRRESGWEGTNTDALAAASILDGVLADLGRPTAEVRVAVLGSGGAARALVHAFSSRGVQVQVHARSAERGQALSQEANAQWGGNLSEVPTDLQVVANATSVGMPPQQDASPVAPDVFGPGVVAYDLVYTPPETRFLREAGERGSRVVTGVDHFVAQARAQLVAWLGDGSLTADWLRRQLGHQV